MNAALQKLTKRGLTLKALDDGGHGVARIARLSEVDHDGDTYQAGAFAGETGEQWCQILAGHNWNHIPLGKARVYEEGDEALAELHFNLAIQAGKDWHASLKFDMMGCDGTGSKHPVQEWSYGFRILDALHEDRDGKRVRVLKRLKVFEVSPVVQGAGVGTRTLTMKNAELKQERFERLTGDLAEIVAAAGADPASLSASGLKQLADLQAGLAAIIEKAGEEASLAHRAAAGQAFRDFVKRNGSAAGDRQA